MVKDFKIGEQTITCRCDGATDIEYYEFFKEDMLPVIMKETIDPDVVLDLSRKVAFIMSKQADGTDFSQLSFKDFKEWLKQFTLLDFVDGAADIISFIVERHQPHAEKVSKKRQSNS